MEDQTKVILRNIFLAVSMKYGAVKVKASWKPSAEGNITVNLETEYTNPDTQFQIEEYASLKEARRVQNLPIDELIASRSSQDWKYWTVTFTFSFTHHNPQEQSIIVDEGEIDWNSIEPAPAGVAEQFHAIAMSFKVLEND
jgi:hypothetical protein